MNIDRMQAGKRSRRGLLQFGIRSAAAMLALQGTQLKAAINGRALVNLQLAGGNDSNNMIVPLDDAGYARYQRARGPLAIPRQQLLPITSSRLGGASFGLHPALAELHYFYQSRSLAVVANVGPADRALAAHVSDELVYVLGGFNSPRWATGMLGMVNYFDIEDRMFTFSNGISMLSATSTGQPTHAARRDNAALLSAMKSAPIRTVFPATSLGRELLQVAQLIYAAPAVGATNPVIFATQGGFDTHVAQLASQASLYAQLDAALAAFERAMDEIGAANQVTLYTQTEFNRPLVPNGQGGTEHGWGGHQLVLGHSVLGGDIYGTFPSLQVGGADDANGNGTWIPSTTNDQYHAVLARWLGVGLEKTRAVFPSLSTAGVQNLHFVA